jgi:hypothetical protein
VVLEKFAGKINRAMYTETLLGVGKEISELRNSEADPSAALTEGHLDKLRMLYGAR